MTNIDLIYHIVAKRTNKEFNKLDYKAEDIKFLNSAVIQATIRFLNQGLGVRWDYICSIWMMPKDCETKARMRELTLQGKTKPEVIKIINNEYEGVREKVAYHRNTTIRTSLNIKKDDRANKV